MVPRPRTHRTHAVRWRTGAGARNDPTGSVAARQRPRAQAGGGRPTGGVNESDEFAHVISGTAAPCSLAGEVAMAHTVDIDHRRAAHHPPYQLDRTPTGRVASAYEPSPAHAGALARDLRAAIEGEVRFDAGTRSVYSTDASNYRQVPIGVVVPHSIEDVQRTIDLCRRHGAPVAARGGGTSLAGQGCNVAVLIDFSKYLHGLLALDPEQRVAVVEPGCVLDTLRDAAEMHGLTFGPDPSTHDHNTLGGMIGNNSCGVHSVMAGRTSDNVEELDILTYDGRRHQRCRAARHPGGRRTQGRDLSGAGRFPRPLRRADQGALSKNPTPG